MAKVKYGSMVVDMRGRLGADIYSRNRSGPYVRSGPASIPSSTADQVTVRDRLASVSELWSSLAEHQRKMWDVAVLEWAKTDVFGDVRVSSGINLFNKVNCNLLQGGLTTTFIPPVPGITPQLDGVSVTGNSVLSKLEISFTATPARSQDVIVVMSTGALSQGTRYVKNLVRQIAILTAAAASPVDLGAEYILKYGAFVSQSRVSIALISMNYETGQKSAPVYATCIVS